MRVQTNEGHGPSPVAWALAANVATILGAWALWSILDRSDPLVTSRRVAASAAVFWAVIAWVLRWRSGELGRVRVSDAGVVVAQFMCLAACLYDVGISIYYLAPQLGLAFVQTISYTYLVDTQWFFVDHAGALDLAAVAVACLIVTHATRSGALMMPFAWALVLAITWQCLVIRPVIPRDQRLTGEMIGHPSLWLLATVVSYASLLCALVAVEGWSVGRFRAAAMREDLRYLTRPQRRWPGLAGTVLAMGLIICAIATFLLVFPASAGAQSPRITAIIVALTAGVAAVCAFVSGHRTATTRLGDLGFGLMTVSLVAVVLSFLPSEPQRLEDRFPLIFNAMLVGCALATSLWLWLARVWDQQLFSDGRAWTTAGHMIPAARRSSFLAASVGALFAVQMGIWPLSTPLDDNTLPRLLFGAGGIVLLIAVVVRGYLQTRWPAFRSLIMLSGFALLVFGFVRFLPHTPFF